MTYNIERLFNWLNTDSKSNFESISKMIVITGMLVIPILIVAYIE